MSETSLTLIDHLCRTPDGESWERLVEIYSPLLRRWIGRYEIQDSDADDLIQDVLLVVMQELPSFAHNRRRGAFRAWLRSIVVNRVRNFWRNRNRDPKVSGEAVMRSLDQLEDGHSELNTDWKNRYKNNVLRMNSGSIFEVAKVLKNLFFLSFQKSLSFREKKMYDRARELVVSEIATVKRQPLDDVENLVKDLLTETYGRLEA